MSGYVLYGSLRERRTLALATVMHVKGLAVEPVEASASLGLSLAARAGVDEPPYLRTPEGFVLGEAHAVLEWLERAHPEPGLLPTTPVRRSVARLLEDWVDCWLVHWPRRGWATLDGLGAHLAKAGFLLGRRPVRADCLLAAWIEAEVRVHPEAEERLAREAPRLLELGDALLEPGAAEDEADDALPISLLAVIEALGRDYHAYLALNQRALKDGLDHVELDLGRGLERLPVDPACERRRVLVAQELAGLDRSVRRTVARMLEPLGAWHVLTLPPVLAVPDPSDPRSL